MAGEREVNLPSNIQTRPIVRWPGVLTPDSERRRSPFFATWRKAMELLERQLRAIDAERIVLQVAMAESDFRIDGLPRANARPSHPGIILNFDTPKGRLEFATDIFRTWEENLRAIALGLEALRKVDRYGITRAPASGRSRRETTGRAASTRSRKPVGGSTSSTTAISGQRFVLLIRTRIRTPTPEEFRKVMRAKELIEP